MWQNFPVQNWEGNSYLKFLVGFILGPLPIAANKRKEEIQRNSIVLIIAGIVCVRLWQMCEGRGGRPAVQGSPAPVNLHITQRLTSSSSTSAFASSWWQMTLWWYIPVTTPYKLWPYSSISFAIVSAKIILVRTQSQVRHLPDSLTNDHPCNRHRAQPFPLLR